jgi:hypothetical protein
LIIDDRKNSKQDCTAIYEALAELLIISSVMHHAGSVLFIEAIISPSMLIRVANLHWIWICCIQACHPRCQHLTLLRAHIINIIIIITMSFYTQMVANTPLV